MTPSDPSDIPLIERHADPELGPRVRVNLEPGQRAIDVGQAINSARVIVHAYDHTVFLTTDEARGLAEALLEASDWQDRHGPIERTIG